MAIDREHDRQSFSPPPVEGQSTTPKSTRRSFLRVVGGLTLGALAASAAPALARAEADNPATSLEAVRPPLFFTSHEGTPTITLKPYVQIRNGEAFSPETFPTAVSSRDLGDGLTEYTLPSAYAQADKRPNIMVVEKTTGKIISARFFVGADNGEYLGFRDYADWVASSGVGGRDQVFRGFNAAYQDLAEGEMDVAFFGRKGFSWVTDYQHIFEIEIFQPTTDWRQYLATHDSDYAPL